MSTSMPKCRTITVLAFRGDRTGAFAANFLNELDDEKRGLGPGPTNQDCLRFAGHSGISTDGAATIYGFNPDGTGNAVWQLMDGLKNGNAFPGIVRDDTAVFSAAPGYGLRVWSFEVILPDSPYQKFKQNLDLQRKKSQYSYGFPNGDGDCNCTTWLERLGLPLLTGRMNEFVALPGISAYPSRRFGLCV
ncbi:MAG TPA: hypothetical protein VND64_08580 [Pirellulales bacterium]|nr:hypothetical protein [Pirellulales bacterium]